METKQKILTLSKQSEEMRIQSMRDKWFRMQEQLTDQAVTLVGQKQEVKNTLGLSGKICLCMWDFDKMLIESFAQADLIV